MIDLADDELVVDGFAGGGGASEGIVRALGRVDIAINHSPTALALHAINHPEARHYCEDIFAVDPVAVCAGRRVGFGWFSPDCTHFSRAKGTVPLSKNIRGLAWVVCEWARKVRPRVICVENVAEFQTWGPLGDDGRPIAERAGETFREWIETLRGLGYEVEWRELVAADYGAPTTRRRLFIVARCDGRAIEWPEPTHGVGRAQPWRAAAEVIDWSLPCPSIFERKRPLKPATLKRIAIGVQRFVIDAPRPFLIPVTHGRDSRVHSIDEPVRTITGANRGELALIAPFVVRHGHYSTITGAGIEEGKGAGTFRGQSIEAPLATVCATNDKHLCVPFITKHYGSPPDRMRAVGHALGAPLSTVTARDHHALSAAFLTKFYGTSIGADLRDPMPTITSGGGRGGGHIAAVQAVLELAGPRRQLGLFDAPPGMLTIDGERYVIADIGMRMLQPPELFRANGFPDDYVIDFVRPDGERATKSDQTDLAGNAVCPQLAEALARANTRTYAEAA